MIMVSPQLTKSKYLHGLQCVKRLWLEVNAPERLAAITPAQRRMIEEGNEIGEFARQRFLGGRLITEPGESAIAATQQAIAEGASCLFEGAFQFEQVLVRCDILEQVAENVWKIIEVKASTKIKPEHVADLAIQRYVLEQCGLDIQATYLMHVNRQGTGYPDVENLLVMEDLSEHVNVAIAQIKTHLTQFKTILQQGEPDHVIGHHCHQPETCPAQSDCWQQVPEASIFTIPRLHQRKKAALIQQGILAIEDLPESYPLSAAQAAYVRSLKHQEPTIDRPAIRQALGNLTYPLYFFDFETLNPALPRFDGMQPYQQFPFQYSCHVLQADGQVTHCEYLHTDTTDPRRALIEALRQHIGRVGSIVVYYATFERGVLNQLAEQFPDYQAELQAIVERLWDQWDIFKKYYQHPDFRGSNSIKKVLPVLVPALNYHHLEVQKGDHAQAMWAAMIHQTNHEEKARQIKALKDYCALDTQAMLEIHRVLCKL